LVYINPATIGTFYKSNSLFLGGVMSSAVKNERLYPSLFHPNYYGLSKLRDVLIDIIDEFLGDSSKNKVLFDYGCGSKPYKEIFDVVCDKNIGADLESNSLADITIDNTTGRVDIEDNTADIVFSTQVMEHVSSPEVYLSEAKRICKDNGWLIISAPGFFPYHECPDDYWRWTASGLRKILCDNGWEVVKMKGVIGYLGVGLSFIQYWTSSKLPSFLNSPFVFIMQRLIWLSDRLFLNTDISDKENCVIYIAVAKKKEIDKPS
jgi:SAM-dependent methyltransferase